MYKLMKKDGDRWVKCGYFADPADAHRIGSGMKEGACVESASDYEVIELFLSTALIGTDEHAARETIAALRLRNRQHSQRHSTPPSKPEVDVATLDAGDEPKVIKTR